MRTVLYTYDLEPITVLELPNAAMHYLREFGMCSIAVMEPIRMDFDAKPTDQVLPVVRRQVRIFAEPLRRGDQEALMLFTHDEESALLLKAAFLPGQYGAVQESQRAAFARGFIDAVIRLGE